MTIIKSITLTDTHYRDIPVFKKLFTLECAPITLLIGDQGVGKSTLLGFFNSNNPPLSIVFSEKVDPSKISFFYFDSEKDNPRMSNIQNAADSQSYIHACLSRFQSHGQVLSGIMIDVIDKMHNTLVVLDEPESGLSLRNQFIFLKTIQAATQRGCQFLIATHAPLFIESHCVFSLDDYAWHSGKAYIQQVRKSLQ